MNSDSSVLPNSPVNPDQQQSVSDLKVSCQEKENMDTTCCQQKVCNNDVDTTTDSSKNEEEPTCDRILKLQIEFMRSLDASWKQTLDERKKSQDDDDDDLPPLVDQDDIENEEEDEEDEEEEDDDKEEDEEEEDDEDDEEDEDEDDIDNTSVVDEIINRMGVMDKIREYSNLDKPNINGLLKINESIRNELLNEMKQTEENSEEEENSEKKDRFLKGLRQLDTIRSDLLCAKKYQNDARWRNMYMIFIWCFFGLSSFLSDPYVKTALVGTYFMFLFRSLFGFML